MNFTQLGLMLGARIRAYLYARSKASDVDAGLAERIRKADADIARLSLAVKKLEAELKRRGRKAASQPKPRQAKPVTVNAQTIPPPLQRQSFEDRNRAAWLTRVEEHNRRLAATL